jgi:preprotein translocase subunit SecA
MNAGVQRIAGAVYAERDLSPRPALDRAVAALGYRLHRGFARRRAADAGFAARVAQQAQALAPEALDAEVRVLRRALRREGPRGALLVRGFALVCAAQRQLGAVPPGPQALAAARLLLRGGVVELADAGARRDALALAATLSALRWNAVHLVAADDARARGLAEALAAPLARLGIGVGCVQRGADARTRADAYARAVVCVAQRELSFDYLRDRLRGAGRAGRLVQTLDALSGDAARRAPLLPAGLECALLDDIDALLLDEARAPVVLHGEDSLKRERLVYEQALELARALTPQRDFVIGAEGAQLSAAGAHWIEQLVGSLGGLWSARPRREALVREALDVLHVLERDRDYRVEQGRVVFPPDEDADAGEAEAQSADRQWLTELKEGCRLSARRDVLARISVPGFYRRYLQLGGVSADVRGAEDEFWRLYGLKTTRVGAPPTLPRCRARVFARHADKLAAVQAAAASAGDRGEALLVALRSPEALEQLRAALGEQGVAPGVLTGAGDGDEHSLLDRLGTPGTVALTVYPAERSAPPPRAGSTPLRLLIVELHDSSRQRARLCRAYGATSCAMLLSLEDDALAFAAGGAALALARAASGSGAELPGPVARALVDHAQRRLARIVALMRQEVRLRDEQLGDLLAFSGTQD